MTRTVVRGVTVCLLLGTAGCAAIDESDKGTSPRLAEQQRPASSRPVGLRDKEPEAKRPRPSVRDGRLVRRFVAFAAQPGAESAARLPFADVVRLGLGSNLIRAAEREQLAHSSTWSLRSPSGAFRAGTGRFSALELVSDHVVETPGLARRFATSVGPHPHCAAPPVPPPRALQKP